MEVTPKSQYSAPYSFLQTHLLLALWVGTSFVPVILALLALILRSASLLTLLIILALVTPHWAASLFGNRLATNILQAASAYFPLHLTLECPERLQQDDKPFIGCIEPHSVLPLAGTALNQRGVFAHQLTSNCWKNAEFLASPIVFRVPFLRHLWSWLRLGPISRSRIKHLLRNKNSHVLLVPGGAEEVLHMADNSETMLLSRRFGLAKAALQCGSDLVPIIAFGQRKLFTYYRLGPPLVPRKIVHKLADLIGVVPLVFFGKWGTPIPRQTPMHVVVGSPIRVPESIAEPSKEQIQDLLRQLMDDTRALYERHRFNSKCSHADVPLTIL
jgi:2-acylglycerol O-acyltransferase 2